MTLINWLIVIVILAPAESFAIWYYFIRPIKRREQRYHIKVKFAYGILTKLVLNETQYQSFKEWLNRPDGYYEIQDDGAFVYLDRQYVASVEMRKR